ncbi:MAG TPA: hypothetical protein VFB07_07210 [Vicinamibacterales bacterium]|nr:hypothetical protein [Vicinamibacterales bacterium]
MELHRRHEHSPFRSWQAFSVEIATIVIGVVIALSFEGVREWQHNRALAAEARETIVRELAENKSAVESDVKSAPRRQSELKNALRYVDDMLQAGKTSIHQIGLNASWGDLRRSGWSTAQQTGALAHMTYAEVQSFAAVYDLQDIYVAQQRRSLEHLSDAFVLVEGGVADPETAKKPDLEPFRERLLTMRADIYMEQQLASQLLERYAHVLKDRVQ